MIQASGNHRFKFKKMNSAVPLPLKDIFFEGVGPFWASRKPFKTNLRGKSTLYCSLFSHPFLRCLLSQLDTDELRGKVAFLSELKDSSRSNGAYKVHEVIEEIRFVEAVLKKVIKNLDEKDESQHYPILVAAPLLMVIINLLGK